MKINIKNSVLLLAAAAMTTGTISSCTDGFESTNTDPYGVETSDVPFGDYFKDAELSIYFNPDNSNWAYQLMQNLNADLYSGYFAVPTPFNGGTNNSKYSMTDGWNSLLLENTNLHVLKPVASILESTEADDLVAIAKVLRVAGVLKVVDTYGPIPYSKTMQGGLFVDYDSEEAIYKSFLEDLADASARLKNFLAENGGDDASRLSFDLMCGNSQTTWLHFCNTLRMRVAMRMVNVDPAAAKEACEAAYADGVMDDSDPDIMAKYANVKNPLLEISTNYNDCNIGASFESILKGYNDPRLAEMVLPVGWGGKGDIKDLDGNPTNSEGEIHGIRNGTDMSDKSEYNMFSIISSTTTGSIYSDAYPLPILRCAEAFFLRAEGALRGWNMGGTAESLYKQGIEVSFNKYGLDASAYDTYIAGTTTAADYVDPHDPANNIAGMNDVPVAWDAAATNEQKLQRIITQRWIANFPEGTEGWAMFRRTGYPKLFPLVKNLSGGLIAEGDFIKRLPFCDKEKNANKQGYLTGLQLLGGDDNIATNLWWDVDGSNF